MNEHTNEHTEHRLIGSAPEDLSAATIATLRDAGVPRELRLPDWEGPTLFSSLLDEGRLVSTLDPASPIRRPEAAYLLGAVREGDGKMYSAFAVRADSGAVWLLDAEDPKLDRFVGTSVDAFLAAMSAFVLAWPRLLASPASVVSFHALLEKLDPTSVADPEHYWPGWLDELDG